MKYLLFFMAAAMLLCGCSAVDRKEPVSPIPTEMQLPTVQTQPQTLPKPDREEAPLLTKLISPLDTDLVRIKDYIPHIFVDLKYATEDNFTGQTIYGFQDAFARYGTVMKLQAVCQELAEQGLYLKVWDGFRPVSAQFRLWEVCPDDTYVANPNVGFSNHSRGYALDVTLVDESGADLEMPTGFDDFSACADRDYSDCSEAAAENARLLETVMKKHGLEGYWGEWWHYNDTTKYDVEHTFDPALIRSVFLQDSVSLKNEAGEEILTIPAGESVTLLGRVEDRALVEYWGYRGYVPADAFAE